MTVSESKACSGRLMQSLQSQVFLCALGVFSIHLTRESVRCFSHLVATWKIECAVDSRFLISQNGNLSLLTETMLGVVFN